LKSFTTLAELFNRGYLHVKRNLAKVVKLLAAKTFFISVLDVL